MKINIPTSLQDITLNQFVEFQNSEQTNQDLVSIFCEIENINLLQLKDFQEITEIVTNALNSNPNFYRRFVYKGVHYGFIPKLDNLSTAEYIDLEMYMAKPETFYKAMSILYRPIVKYKRNWFKRTEPFYDIAPYTGTNEIFKQPVFVSGNMWIYTFMSSVDCVFQPLHRSVLQNSILVSLQSN